MIEANNPNLTSWVEVNVNSDFPIQNLPFGIFSFNNEKPRIGVAIGKSILDVYYLASNGYLKNIGFNVEVLFSSNLNELLKLGKPAASSLRNRLSEILRNDNSELRDNKVHKEHALIPMDQTQMHLPVQIGDYTDFYSSKEHATNVGIMFRGKENALMPNWLHIPVGYHGRSSSILVSGVDIHRPKGQMIPNDSDTPVFGKSKLLDFELEMGFITYEGKPLGESISTKEAEDYIFGMVLFNDWSARDIQKWEYVPLGPFLGKNFASHISPWIITMDALQPYAVESPKQEPKVLPYLEQTGKKSYDINLETLIKPENSTAKSVNKSNHKYLYWSLAQQLAHHTINGCNIKAGDMCASGTISGPTEDSFGSMLELSWKGTKSLKMNDGSERKFIQDYDTVIMRGYCDNGTTRIGFGEVAAKVLPAK